MRNMIDTPFVIVVRTFTVLIVLNRIDILLSYVAFSIGFAAFVPLLVNPAPSEMPLHTVETCYILYVP